MRKLLMLVVAVLFSSSVSYGQLIYTNIPDEMAWPAGKRWITGIFDAFSNAYATAGATNVQYDGGVTGSWNSLYVKTAPASVLSGGTIPATGGAIVLGTNVSLQGVTVPLTGGALVLGSNVSIRAISIPATGGAIVIPTNMLRASTSGATNIIKGVGWTQTWVSVAGQIVRAAIEGNSP